MYSSSNNSFSDNALDNSFSSKFRRLKIQENILSANVNKCFLVNAEENDEKVNYDKVIEVKKYLSKLKDKFREAKHLFEDISLKTNDQEYLEKSDIDELKRDILELENKIRSAKQFLINELQNLRSEEIALMEKQETSETLSQEGRKAKRRTVPQIKGYKEIVTSPVRAMIYSPFKCLEVQQFQDFMKNSLNRYGGWNEYNHNIFVQIWNNYYEDNKMFAVKSIEDTFSYQDFKEEVLRKILGSSLESIESHSKWYSEYLRLKLNQQKALNKWKENKRKIRRKRKVRAAPSEIDELSLHELKSPVNTKLCRKQNHGNDADGSISNRRNRVSFDTFNERTAGNNIIFRNKKLTLLNDTTKESKGSNSAEIQSLSLKLDLKRLLRPTKQWLIKQESEKEIYECNKSVEAISKLRIPTWRLNLTK